MNATDSKAGGHDRRVILSTLWIVSVFNYMYADILTLYFGSALQPSAWRQLMSGHIGSMHITQGIGLLGGVVLETAIVMPLLARILPYQPNRWANILVGVIQTAAVAMSLPAPLYQNWFYVFFSVIEIATTLFIIWYALTWRRPAGASS